MNEEMGWIKVCRSEMNEWMWADGTPFDKFHAWLDILLNVNYTTKQVPLKNDIITLEPGCLLTSIVKLSERWTWDRKTVGRFLRHLKKSGKIDFCRFGNGILIKTLDERDNPQCKAGAEADAFFYTHEGQPVGQPEGQPVGQPSGQPDGQPMHITNKERIKENKECKKERREEETARTDKKNYSEHILLTADEYDSLRGKYGEATVDSAIELVGDYKAMTGKHYESDYLAIRKWGIKAAWEQKEKAPGKS